MAQLPTGTVTFLFTDIEGSTRLAQARPGDWPRLLGRHREIVREAVAAHAGVEVGTEGDSFFVAFDSATGGVAAAADAQRALAAEPWPDGASIRVRMGLHTGEAEVRDGSYVGVAVHRAARIGSAGHGGQVLISDATRALVVESLPPGVGLLALGRHRLKDLEGDEGLTQLVVDELPTEFPPLRTLDATPNNLPTQVTSFLGREEAVREITALLAQVRLLTLTGPAGTGKTRLALRVAASVMDRFPDGVFFVPLGSIAEVELVVPTIAREVGLPDRGGSRPMERLTAHLRDRRALLVLDNFEQVLGAAPLIGELLAGVATISVLATSRSPLHVYGEHEYGVPPLEVPDPRHLPALDKLSQYESVALFIDRARAAVPTFMVRSENAPAIAEICYRLDGLPLAIELAAARVKLLTPQAILARLAQSTTLLSGGARDLPARQQTLRGAIDWSYDLLDDGDRKLFAGFAIFVGGAGLEAVEAVCDDPELDVLDHLASLVDKSLARRGETADGEPRFSMLETIRDYALEKLRDSGRHAEIAERHATWYLELAERAADAIMGADKRRWLDTLDVEHENLRAATTWATDAGRAEMAMRLVSALWRFWQMRGYLKEGLERTRAALAMPGAVELREGRARALDAAGGLAYWIGDGDVATAFYEQELALRRELGDRAGEAWVLYSLSFTYTYNDSARSAKGDIDKERLQRALDLVSEAVRIYDEIGDRAGRAQALWAESNVLWALDPETNDEVFHEARRTAREALGLFREIGDSFMIGWTCYTLALTAIRVHELDEARALLSEAIRIFDDAGDVTGYVLVLDGFAAIAFDEEDWERAARLSGAVSTLERRTGTGLAPLNRFLLRFEPDRLRDDPATAATWAEGERMTTPEAIAYALEVRATPERRPA
jgi:predicted ATPase/class 3 adenylate cyclase